MALSKEDLDLLNAPASPSLFGSAPAQSSRDDLFAYAQQTADELGIPRDIANRLIKTESGGNPDAVSPKGAFGPAQLMPPTAKYLEQRYGGNAADPRDNIRLGMSYLKENYDRFGDWRLAAAAYHAGPGAVEKAGGVPPGGDGKMSTADYSSTVAGTMKSIAGSMGNGADLLPPTPPARTTMADMSAATAPGINTYEAPEETNLGAMKRGATTAVKQIPQLAAGAAAYLGDVMGSDWVKRWGLDTYNSISEDISKDAKPYDDIGEAIKSGNLAKWVSNATGYSLVQLGQALATGGIASIIGKAGIKRLLTGTAERATQEALQTFAIEEGEKAFASAMAQKLGEGAAAAAAQKAFADTLANAAVKEAAAKVGQVAAATAAAKYGALAGMSANSGMMEAGQIYPEAVEEARKTGKPVDLTKVGIASALAASLDVLPEARILGKVMGEGVENAGKSLRRRVLNEVPKQTLFESATEGAQTPIEHWGANQDPTSPENVKDAVNSAAMGGVGGLIGGGLAAIPKPPHPAPGKTEPPKWLLNSPLSNAISAAGPAPVTPGAGVPPAGGSTPSTPADPFTSDPGIAPRLAAIDALLSNRDLLGSLRAQQPDMVDQALYVRNAMVGNPDLPVRTRLNALDHLEATLQSVPDFTMGNNGEPPSAPGTSMAPVAGGEIAPVRPVQGGAMDIPGRVIDGESSRVDGATGQPTLPRQMLPRPALSTPAGPIDNAAGNGQSTLPAPSDSGRSGTAAMSQDEYARHLVANGLPDGVSAYDALTASPDLRGLTAQQRVELFNSRRAEVDGFRTRVESLWQSIRNAGESGLRAIGAGSGWTNFEVGTDTHQRGEDRHKSYASIRDFISISEADLAGFLNAMRSAGYNGQVKFPGVGARALLGFDNIVMHGATEADAKLGERIARQHFGSRVSATQFGKDSAGQSHTQILADQVERGDLRGGNEQAQATPDAVSAQAPDKSDVPGATKALNQSRAGFDTIRHMIGQGFTGISQGANGWQLVHPKTGQTFPLKTPAEVQVARVAVNNQINDAAHQAATSDQNDKPQPSEAQKKAGNYAKGHVDWNGFDVSIENPKGSKRSGIDPGGKPWSVDMPGHYGYFKNTLGKDGDQVDLYLGGTPHSDHVFVVDQVDANSRAFDEHKVIGNVRNEEEAKALYDAGFSDGKGPQRRGAITKMSMDEFRNWLKNEDTTKPVAYKEQAKNQGEISSAERYAQIERGFAENREAMKGLRVGDTVSWVDRGTYTQKDGSKIVDPVKTGKITKIQDKEQGTIVVDGLYTIGARFLTKAQEAEAANSSARVSESDISEAGDKSWSLMPQPVRDFLKQWVEAQGPELLSRIRKASDELWGGKKNASTPEDVELLRQLYASGKPIREFLASKADENGFITLFRGLRNSTLTSGHSVESYTLSRRVAENFAGEDGRVIESRIHVNDVITLANEPEQELIVRSPVGENSSKDTTASDETATSTSDLPIGGETSTPEAPAAEGKEASHAWIRKEIESLIFLKAAARQHDKGRSIDKLIALLKRYMDGEDVKPGKIQSFIPEFKAVPKAQEIVQGIYDHIKAESNKAAAEARKKAKDEKKAATEPPSTPPAAEEEKQETALPPASEPPKKSPDEADNAAKKEAAIENQFSGNKIFTADKVAAARERMKKKLGTLNSGLDPEMMIDGMTIAGAYIESGIRNFGAYARAMVSDFGDGIKPYLLSFYEGARHYPGIEKDGMSSAEEAAATYQDMMEPAEQSFEHAGFRIYPINYGGAPGWAVQTIDNVGTDRVFGDTLHRDVEEAKKEAERQAKRVEERKEIDAKEAEEKAASEAKKEANRGLTITQRRANAALDKPTKLPVNAGVGRGTRREAMESAVRNDRLISMVMVYDSSAYKQDEDEQGRLHRAGYSVFGNDQHPSKKRYDELAAKMKDRSNYQKPEYRLYSGRSTDDSFWEISKTEYDYARQLEAERKEAPQEPPKEIEPVHAADLTSRVTVSDNLRNGDIVVDGDGRHYIKVEKLHNYIEVAPIVDGKPVVYAGSLIRFTLDDVSRANNPDARHDALIKTGDNWYDLDQKSKNSEAATAMHVEAGKVEPATAAVISASVAKSAKATPMNSEQAREWLLGEIDKAILGAEAKNNEEWNDAVEVAGKDYKREDFYVVFDVPGDGKFSVRNNIERLKEFKKEVMASAGFKKPRSRPMSYSPSQAKTSVRDMLDDGELMLAVDYGALTDKPVMFGAKNDGQAIIYTDVDDVDLDGFSLKIGREWLPDLKRLNWAVIEQNTGLSFASGKTREAALSKANSILDEPANVEKLNNAIAQAEKVSQEDLKKRWTDWAMTVESGKEAKRIAKEKQDKADAALWEALFPERKEQFHAHYTDADLMMEQAYRAGKGNEFLSAMSRQSANAQAFITEARTALNKLIKSNGGKEAPDTPVDYKGWQRTPTGNGAFTLKSGNIVVRAEPRLNGLYQAFFGSGKSGPRMTEQDVVDWAVTLKEDFSGAPEEKKYSGPADVSSKEGQHELADRAGVIASLTLMNEQIRKLNPDAAWHDSQIADARDLDALRIQISDALMVAQRGETPEVGADLRKMLNDLSGEELKEAFRLLNLAGSRLTASERVDMLMSENHNEVWQALDAMGIKKPGAEAPATAESGKHFESVDALNALTNPVENSDWIKLTNGEEWQARQGYSGMGWSLVKDGKTHPMATNIDGQSQFIRAIIEADAKAEKSESPQKSKVPNPDANFVDSVSGEHVSLTDAQRDFLRTTKKREQENIDAGKSVGEVSLFAFDGSIYLAITRPGGSEWNVARLEDDGRVTGAKEGTHNGLMGFGFDDRRVNLIPESEFKKSKAEAAQRSQEWSDKAAEEAKPTWYSYKGINSTFPRSLIKMNGKWYRVGTDNKLLRIGRRNGDWTILDAISNNPGEWEAGDKVNVDANGVFSPVKDEEQADANTFTEAEALKRTAWKDMGTQGGIRTYVLEFFDSEGNIETGRGAMRHSYIEQSVGKGGDKKYRVYSRDGSYIDPAYDSLRIAKKAGEGASLESIKADGYIRESAIDKALRSVGIDPNAPVDKAKQLRRDAEKLQNEARAMLAGIPAGQPVGSIRDVNLREKAAEKSRKAGAMFKEADRLDAEKVDAGDTVTAEENSGVESAPIHSQKETGTYTLAEHEELMSRINGGEATIEEYQSAFARLKESREAITEELSKLTKEQLMKVGNLPYHYRSDTKDKLVRAAGLNLLEDFDLRETRSYVMGNIEGTLTDVVAKATPETLSDFHFRRTRAINEFLSERQKRNEGIENPRTLEDFHNIMRAGKKRAELTEEQKALWDELQAAADTDWIESDKERKAAQPVTVAAQTTEGRIVENRHTKTGEELFTVQGSERVAPEVFSQWKVTAKGLDGYYSSFKGNGAVPGWIFKKRENAEAFLKYIGGDVEEVKQAIAEQKESDKDDASQSTVERLNSMADKMIDKADESLGRDRRTNTARQSRLANGAEREANSLKALAETMQNIARRISDGSIKHLKNLRTRAQVEMLRDFVNRGHSNWARSQTDNYGKQQDLEASPVTSEAAEYAEFPYYMASVETLSQIAAKLAGKPGAKLVAARIAKFVEAVQDKAYAEAVNESPLKFALFKKDSMEPAIFGTEAEAKRSARFSGLADSTEVKSIGRGKHVVVIDRQTAINQKRYVPKDVGNLRIAPEQAEEMLAKVAVFNGTASRWDQINNLWWLDTVKERRSRLKAMGIQTPAQFRSALREFIGLREAPKELDKAKELERALIGQKNVGVDFFPTPVAVAQDMVDRAGIEEGMAVLEPSAGNGNIAEAIREAGAEPDVAEISGQLRDILEAKGFSVIQNDFTNIKPREGYTYGDLFQHKDGRKGIMRGSGGMGSGRVGFVPEGKTGREFEWVDRDDLTGIRHLGDSSGYDRIVMNPPFSNNLDIQHVRHAYDLLRPGGRIVAIVGEGAFNRSGKTETEFRAWLDALGAEIEELPANTFKSSELLSKTGANARMVVIDKPAGDGVVASTAANAVPMEDWLSVRVLTEVAGEAFKKLGHYPTLKILDTPEDAGVATGDRTFSGFVRNQIIHLVRNGIASRDEAIDTVWHELFHYGLRRFMTREQYIADMNKLYGRDAFLKLKADAWIKNDPVAKKLRDAGESEDYIKARGADEALAWFAESIRGNQEFRNSGLKGKAIRTITRWLAEIADFFGANRVASQIRAYTNEEARRYVMSVFGKFNDDSVEVLAWDGDKPTFMTAGNDRDRSREESLKRNADEIRAMDPDVRDDTEYQNFPGGYHAHNLYEAQNLLPKPSDKLKRVTENNTDTLSQDYDYIANVDGEHFGISKYEDPDEVDDDTKFVYAFQKLTDQGALMTETVTDDKEELFKAMRAALSGMESRGETAAITGALPEAIRKAFVKAFGERSIRQLEARGLAHIVPSASDLPPGIDISPKAKAVFQNNQAWFIADRMVPEAAHREMLHEIGEHYGLERMLGVEGYDSLLQRVKDLRDQGDAHTVAAWNTVLKSYPKEVPGSRRFMHEVLAQLGQNADIQARPWWKQIIEAVKRFLIRQGFTGMIRHGDIQDMVLHSLKMAAKPLPTGPGGGIRGLEMARAMQSNRPGQNAVDTSSPAFRAWFGNSKVVDAEGKPLVVYHGTQGDIYEFDPEAEPNTSEGDRGLIFLTNSKKKASGYAEDNGRNEETSGANVMPVFLAMASPKVVTIEGMETDASEYYDEHGHYLVPDAKDAGHDGLIIENLDTGEKLFVAFRNTQIKSAISNTGEFDPYDANILHSNPAPVFYSALANTVPAMAKIADKSGMVSPTAAKAWLLARQKEGKFKSDELNWSGLLDWLDMKNNAPVFGPGFGVIEEYQNEDGKWEQVDDLGSYHRTRAEAEAAIKTLPTPKSEDGALNRLAVREWPSIDLGKRGEKVAVADIEAFVRDNGVQVKEVMLGDSGPSFDAAVEEKLNEQIRGIADDANNDYWYQTLNDESERNGQEWIELSTRERKQLLESLYSPEDRFSMVSSDLASDMEQEIRDEMRDGFAEENHVATKFDEKQLPGGENYRELLLTLPTKIDGELPEGFEVREFAEGRWGVFGPGPLSENRYGSGVNREAALRTFYNLHGGSVGAPVFKSTHFSQPNIIAHVRFNERTDADGKRVLFLEELQSDWAQKGRKEGFAGTLEGAKKFYGISDEAWSGMSDEERHSFVDEMRGSRGAVHSAPFVGKTEAWVALALKRMIRYAAENGFDRVAWTNGEQQAARYDLSKQVDRVAYNERTGALMAWPIGASRETIPSLMQKVPIEDVGDYIGKDAAEKLVAAKSNNQIKEISGINLKVGGEGMKGFYDKIVPAVANDVLKKLGGGKVGVVEIATHGKRPVVMSNGMIHPTKTEQITLKQPGFDITPEMRAKVMEGQPLFSKGQDRIDFTHEILRTDHADIKTPPASSSQSGTPYNGMQERPEVRADESGSPEEPAQSRNQGEAGGRETNPNDIQAAAQAFRYSQPIDKYEYEQNLKDTVAEIMDDWSRGNSDDYSRKYGPDQVRAQMETEDKAKYFDEDGDHTSEGERRYNELEEQLSKRIAREHLGEPQRKEVDFSRPSDMARFLHDYLDKNGYWVGAVGGSGKSDSQYFDIKINGENRTLRISDHKLPLEYAGSDMELPLYDMTGDVRDDGREESGGISQEEALRRASALVRELSGGAGAPSLESRGNYMDNFKDEARSPRKWFDNALDRAASALKGSDKFGWLDKSVHTQLHKAQKNKYFGEVFRRVQIFMSDASRAALRPAEMAPTVLPRIDVSESIGPAFRALFKGKKASADIDAAFASALRGTLEDRVYKDAESAGLTPEQFSLYREFRDSIDASLDELSASEAWALARPLFLNAFGRMTNEGQALKKATLDNPAEAGETLLGHIQSMLDEAKLRAQALTDKAYGEAPFIEKDGDPLDLLRAALSDDTGNAQQNKAIAEAIEAIEAVNALTDTANKMAKIFSRRDQLQREGYAPLMRFGQYYLTITRTDPLTGERMVNEETGEPETEFFGLFESEAERDRAIKAFKEEYGDSDYVDFDSGTMSEEEWRRYKGVSPETVALFAGNLGIDTDTVFQEWYRKAVANRSALKRLIHRKGTPGFSTDGSRVLASFLTSNGRRSSMLYHVGDIQESIDAFPKQMGVEKDEAIRLADYIQNPEEEANTARSLMFMHFLGGSISNLFINATQPAMLTLPYLSQFVSKGRAMSLLKDAYGMVRKPETIPDEIKSALAQAEQEGKVGAQEIHHLWQETARPLANAMGKLGEGWAYRGHAFMHLWGIPFALAEHMNRQVTFISSYQTAKENGATPAQAYAAAVRAIDETQFIYNKANRPDWARGKVGSVVFTFRLFSLSYTELMIRMLRGNKENRKAALFALGLLFAAAGAQGLPGADDLDDLIDTIGQMLGYNVSSKLAKRKWVEDIAGKELAQVVMYGLSSLTPLDVQGRMSLGNLIPGTGVLKPSNDKKFADILEIVGPAGGLATAYINTADAVATGNWGRAGTEWMPKAIKDAWTGWRMAYTGEYRDARGRKVQDVDALDALVKAIGFSPQDVSSAGRNIRSVQQEIDFAKRTESLIAEKWARGIVDQDPDAISAAKEELAQWNTRNPETPIGIKLSQVARRANEMRATKEERFLKSATKEMRETVKEAIE